MPKIALRERQNFRFANFLNYQKEGRKSKSTNYKKRIFFRFAETVVKEEKSVTKKESLKTNE